MAFVRFFFWGGDGGKAQIVWGSCRQIPMAICLCFTCNFRGVKGLFLVDWQTDGLVTLRSVANGRFVTARLNGSLQATVDQSALGDRERFTLMLTNRPRLFLKCEHGFVGLKSSASPARVECNRAFSDPVTLVPVRQMLKDTNSGHTAAAYYLQGNCVNVLQIYC